jgi:hypothetical protein
MSEESKREFLEAMKTAYYVASQRERIATACLAAMVVRDKEERLTHETLAWDAANLADALIAELDKGSKK